MEEDSALKLCNTEGGLHHKGLWRPLWVDSTCAWLVYIFLFFRRTIPSILQSRSIYSGYLSLKFCFVGSWRLVRAMKYLVGCCTLSFWLFCDRKHLSDEDAGQSGNSRKNKKYAYCLVFRPLTFSFSHLFALALVFSYDFHAGAETMFSRHFNDPAADSYFTKRKWGEFVLPPFLLHPAENKLIITPDPPPLLATFWVCFYLFVNEVIHLDLYRCFFLHCIARGVLASDTWWLSCVCRMKHLVE